MIIGLCGYKGVGKSTVAKYLEKEHGFQRVNFKDGLVAEIKIRFPELLKEISEVTGHNVDGLFEEKPALMRALMQNYGTDVRRADREDYWVDMWNTTVSSMKGNIVADDVRFYNELATLGDVGGVLIRVTRTDVKRASDHQSEVEHENFIEDFTIEGEPSSHDKVYKQIESVLQDIKNNVD